MFLNYTKNSTGSHIIWAKHKHAASFITTWFDKIKRLETLITEKIVFRWSLFNTHTGSDDVDEKTKNLYYKHCTLYPEPDHRREPSVIADELRDAGCHLNAAGKEKQTLINSKIHRTTNLRIKKNRIYANFLYRIRILCCCRHCFIAFSRNSTSNTSNTVVYGAWAQQADSMFGGTRWRLWAGQKRLTLWCALTTDWVTNRTEWKMT